MKSVLLLSCSLFFINTSVSFAAEAPAAVAEKAFSDSALVKAAITALNKKGHTKSEKVESIEIGGGCGIAGCSSEFLVVQRWVTENSHSLVASVMARVMVPAFGNANLELVELKSTAAKPPPASPIHPRPGKKQPH